MENISADAQLAIDKAHQSQRLQYEKYLDDAGNFDPRKLPMETLTDKAGNFQAYYLKPMWRQFWFNFFHPYGSPIRLETEVVSTNPKGSHVIARVVNTEEPPYLIHDGTVVMVRDEGGVERPVYNPKYVIAKDHKEYGPEVGRGKHLESAITGAIGRVLARIGFGTEAALEFELPDTVDSPVNLLPGEENRPPQPLAAPAATRAQPVQPERTSQVIDINTVSKTRLNAYNSFMRTAQEYQLTPDELTAVKRDAVTTDKPSTELTAMEFAKMRRYVVQTFPAERRKPLPRSAQSA